jgi:HEAT repeat protein
VNVAERIDAYRQTLRALDDPEPYLLEHSGLPGPRANLELLEAAADELDASCLRELTTRQDEFLSACGATGLGRLAAAGDETALARLRELAEDPRWRVREGVAMALQRIGDADPARLLAIVRDWSAGSPLQRRAAAAGLCEPRLLRDADVAKAAVKAVDAITASLRDEPRPRAPEVRVLRQALGYCWSVAIVAAPEPGKAAFERLATADDPDLRWIVRENLGKSRLLRLDADWVAELRDRTGQTARPPP